MRGGTRRVDRRGERGRTGECVVVVGVGRKRRSKSEEEGSGEEEEALADSDSGQTQWTGQWQREGFMGARSLTSPSAANRREAKNATRR